MEAVILDEKGVVAGEVITGYHQGSTLVLTCDIIGGKRWGNRFPFPSRPLFVSVFVNLTGGHATLLIFWGETVCLMILAL